MYMYMYVFVGMYYVFMWVCTMSLCVVFTMCLCGYVHVFVCMYYVFMCDVHVFVNNYVLCVYVWYIQTIHTAIFGSVP